MSDNTELLEEQSRDLSPGVSQFVENMGLLLEKYGLPRIGGRLMGLLMVMDEPLSLDDLSGMLKVSRASISTNVRMSEMGGVALRVTKPGDRRDYYTGPASLWANTIVVTQRDLNTMREAGLKALALLSPDETVARLRLEELTEFCQFFAERCEQIMEDWQSYRARVYGNQPPE